MTEFQKYFKRLGIKVGPHFLKSDDRFFETFVSRIEVHVYFVFQNLKIIKCKILEIEIQKSNSFFQINL